MSYRQIVIRFSKGITDCDRPQSFRTGTGTHPALYSVGTVGSYLGLKRLKREAGQSPCVSAEVQNRPLSLPSWCEKV